MQSIYIQPRKLLIAGLFSLLIGCSTSPERRLEDTTWQTVEQCQRLLKQAHQVIKKNRVRDAGALPVKGYDYLRTDRFLASYAKDTLGPAQFKTWVDRMQFLGDERFKVELQNLPENARAELPPPATIKQCGNILRASDTAQANYQSQLLAAVKPPSEYQSWKRVLGLYWLSVWMVKRGANQLYDSIRATYQIPVTELDIHGQLVNYQPSAIAKPLNTDQIGNILRRSSANALTIPEPNAREAAQLFDTFAPIWKVDQVTNDDYIGAPYWSMDAKAAQINTNKPTVYRYLSHTRFEGKVLLQLNYVVWFPARTAQSKLDLYAGHLDGIIWRVTLGPDGKPLIYDAAHNCGCYHSFYPTSNYAVKPAKRGLYEPPFSPQQAPPFDPEKRLVLHLASATHLIDRVTQQPVNKPDGKAIIYNWADYNTLLNLPIGGQHKSLFMANGIVDGTQRKERWLLWLTGVPGPGEMRQSGHHAIAFIGRRHFDDAHLLDDTLQRVKGSE